MDPQLRLLLETSYEAIFDAGYDPASLRGRKVAVFIGCDQADTQEALSVDTDKIDGYALFGGSRSMFSNRISYSLDIHGTCSRDCDALDQGSQREPLEVSQSVTKLY